MEKLLNLLKEHGLHTLRLTDEQKQEFNDLFSELFTRSTIANGREMNSSIARMAVNICRIMSVVAMLRALKSSAVSIPGIFSSPAYTGQGNRH